MYNTMETYDRLVMIQIWRCPRDYRAQYGDAQCPSLSINQLVPVTTRAQWCLCECMQTVVVEQPMCTWHPYHRHITTPIDDDYEYYCLLHKARDTLAPIGTLHLGDDTQITINTINNGVYLFQLTTGITIAISD